MNLQQVIVLADHLRAKHYEFVTITPESHRAVLARDFDLIQANLRDVFGWNRPFKQACINHNLLLSAQEAGILSQHSEGWKSNIRFSTLENHLFMHSAYPTTDEDTVFFGPDSYRYARLIKQTVASMTKKRRNKVIDIGTGSGVGGVVLASALQHQYESLLLTDINPKALEYAKINLAINQTPRVEYCISDLYESVTAPFDIIVSNPPYLVDSSKRAYRHGGGEYGSLLSTRIVLEGLPLLADDGVMMLYTASPIVDGNDLFLDSIKQIFSDKNYSVVYEEIDCDVFGEELSTSAYRQVDRIALISLVVHKINH